MTFFSLRTSEKRVELLRRNTIVGKQNYLFRMVPRKTASFESSPFKFRIVSSWKVQKTAPVPPKKSYKAESKMKCRNRNLT
jgi:hypothetical protein